MAAPPSELPIIQKWYERPEPAPIVVIRKRQVPAPGGDCEPPQSSACTVASFALLEGFGPLVALLMRILPVVSSCTTSSPVSPVALDPLGRTSVMLRRSSASYHKLNTTKSLQAPESRLYVGISNENSRVTLVVARPLPWK